METTQLQNETLIQLIIAARYQDGKLSLSEAGAAQNRIGAMNWDSGTAVGVFIQQATATVREALQSSDTKHRFLKSACSVFETPEAKTDVIDTLEKVVAADGIDPKEHVFLQEIKNYLGH